MKDVLIVQNISREGPGLLEEVLAEHSIAFDLADQDRGEQFPSPVGYKAVVVLGGPDSANDTTPKMNNELAQARTALDEGIPYLGICLGLQVLVKAGGGQVVPGAQKEIGFRAPDKSPFTIELTADGRTDPLFDGLPGPLRVFQLHGETVELTDSMRLLATGALCTNQVIRLGENAYGIQSHFEVTDDMLRTWTAEDPDLVPLNFAELFTEYGSIREEYRIIGKTLFTNFLKIAHVL